MFQGGGSLGFRAGEHVQFVAERPKPTPGRRLVPSIELAAAEGEAVLIHAALLSSDVDGSEAVGPRPRTP